MAKPLATFLFCFCLLAASAALVYGATTMLSEGKNVPVTIFNEEVSTAWLNVPADAERPYSFFVYATAPYSFNCNVSLVQLNGERVPLGEMNYFSPVSATIGYSFSTLPIETQPGNYTLMCSSVNATFTMQVYAQYKMDNLASLSTTLSNKYQAVSAKQYFFVQYATTPQTFLNIQLLRRQTTVSRQYLYVNDSEPYLTQANFTTTANAITYIAVQSGGVIASQWSYQLQLCSGNCPPSCPNLCSGNGACLNSLSGTPTCTCDVPYNGTDCSQNVLSDFWDWLKWVLISTVLVIVAVIGGVIACCCFGCCACAYGCANGCKKKTTTSPYVHMDSVYSDEEPLHQGDELQDDDHDDKY